MALNKEFTTEFDLTASYWRVTMISLDRREKYGSVTAELFAKPEAKRSIDNATFMIYEEDYVKFFEGEGYDNIAHACYEFLKTKEYFVDSLDC